MEAYMNIHYTNLDKTKTFPELAKAERKNIADLLSAKRIAEKQIPAGASLTYNYAAMPIDTGIQEILQKLADEVQAVDKYQALLNGRVMNTGESRRVLHHLLRGQLGKTVEADGENKAEFYSEQFRRIGDFAGMIHNGEIRGSTGKPFKTVVQIGIGGSDLGPRALYLALKGYVQASETGEKMQARFISNVDPDDAAAVLGDLDFSETLFILVSKSGTTQETLTNRDLALQLMDDYSRRTGEKLNPACHMTAVTSKSSPLADSSDFLDSFFIDDYIGGRYSSSSAVGGLVLSLAFGPDVFREFLAGAHEADSLALERDIQKNAALMDALIGVYLRNVLHYPATAVLPYSQALSRFPAHLQQLDMESNGKQVNRDGKPVSYSTGPVIFGEPGTNGQHSFYQLLHQGTDIVPLQFIAFRSSQYGIDTIDSADTADKVKRGGAPSSHAKLQANLTAQIIAFARGKEDENRNRHFPGGRPSSLLVGDRLTPKTLGALLAHFENKVMFQGFIWNINSFDQEGVQLGKVLTKQVLASDTESGSDPLLDAYFAQLMN
ncbi:MAG: glucose-6-phosphate isomerase [Spirochaetia bacterium]|nr:glucose-6-phosphate isomerase [Spirochaetia bacterium]